MDIKPNTENVIEGRIHELTGDFNEYIEVFNRYRMWNSAKFIHIQTINMRRDLGINGSIDSDRFLESLRKTLVGWGMNARGAKLVNLYEFKRQFREHKALVISLDGGYVTELNSYVDDMWKTIESLELSESGTQIVTGSKALHHLVPKLLPPIDRRYTGSFFEYERSATQFSHKCKVKQKEAFQCILNGFSLIAQKVDLSRYVNSNMTTYATYATSESKVIDNAIIGYVIKHNLQ